MHTWDIYVLTQWQCHGVRVFDSNLSRRKRTLRGPRADYVAIYQVINTPIQRPQDFTFFKVKLQIHYFSVLKDFMSRCTRFQIDILFVLLIELKNGRVAKWEREREKKNQSPQIKQFCLTKTFHYRPKFLKKYL